MGKEANTHSHKLVPKIKRDHVGEVFDDHPHEGHYPGAKSPMNSGGEFGDHGGQRCSGMLEKSAGLIFQRWETVGSSNHSWESHTDAQHIVNG